MNNVVWGLDGLSQSVTEVSFPPIDSLCLEEVQLYLEQFVEYSSP